MKKSKYVESWFVTKDPNNIYTLLINTTQKGCYHHYYGDDENSLLFQISDSEDQDLLSEEITFEIPKFLPDIEGVWQCGCMTEKDQIMYYFIPYLWKWIHEKEIILNSRTL